MSGEGKGVGILLRERAHHKNSWMTRLQEFLGWWMHQCAGSVTINQGLAACLQESQTYKTGASEKGKRFIQVPITWEDGRFLSPSPSPHLRAGRCFSKDREEKQNNRSRGRDWKVLHVQTSIVHSDEDLQTGQVMFWYASCWFYIILVLWLKVSKSRNWDD